MSTIQLFITANTNVERNRWVNVLAGYLTREAGGCTVFEARGYYEDRRGRVTSEPSTVILSTVDQNQVDSLLRVLAEYAVCALQEAVFYLQDNEPHFHYTVDLARAYDL